MKLYVWKCQETGKVVAVIASDHASAIEAVDKQADEPHWRAGLYRFVGEYEPASAAIVRMSNE